MVDANRYTYDNFERTLRRVIAHGNYVPSEAAAIVRRDLTAAIRRWPRLAAWVHQHQPKLRLLRTIPRSLSIDAIGVCTQDGTIVLDVSRPKETVIATFLHEIAHHLHFVEMAAIDRTIGRAFRRSKESRADGAAVVLGTPVRNRLEYFANACEAHWTGDTAIAERDAVAAAMLSKTLRRVGVE